MSANSGSAALKISTDSTYGDYLIITTHQDDPDGKGSLSITWEIKENNDVNPKIIE